MKCKTCGNDNLVDSNFCSSCGRSLHEDSQLNADIISATIVIAPIDGPESNTTADFEEAKDIQELAPGDAMLFVRQGPNAGASYLLSELVVKVGRNPSNDIFLDDVTVSRNHAHFIRSEGSYVLKDLNSLNGTYVNGSSTEEVILTNGDEIQIGKFKFHFFSSNSISTN